MFVVDDGKGSFRVIFVFPFVCSGLSSDSLNAALQPSNRRNGEMRMPKAAAELKLNLRIEMRVELR